MQGKKREVNRLFFNSKKGISNTVVKGGMDLMKLNGMSVPSKKCFELLPEILENIIGSSITMSLYILDSGILNRVYDNLDKERRTHFQDSFSYRGSCLENQSTLFNYQTKYKETQGTSNLLILPLKNESKISGCIMFYDVSTYLNKLSAEEWKFLQMVLCVVIENLLTNKIVEDAINIHPEYMLPGIKKCNDMLEYIKKCGVMDQYTFLCVWIQNVTNVIEEKSYNTGIRLIEITGNKIQTMLKKNEIVVVLHGDRFGVLLKRDLHDSYDFTNELQTSLNQEGINLSRGESDMIIPSLRMAIIPVKDVMISEVSHIYQVAYQLFEGNETVCIYGESKPLDHEQEESIITDDQTDADTRNESNDDVNDDANTDKDETSESAILGTKEEPEIVLSSGADDNLTMLDIMDTFVTFPESKEEEQEILTEDMDNHSDYGLNNEDYCSLTDQADGIDEKQKIVQKDGEQLLQSEPCQDEQMQELRDDVYYRMENNTDS